MFPRAKVIDVSGLSIKSTEAEVWLTGKDKNVHVALSKDPKEIGRFLKSFNFKADEIDQLVNANRYIAVITKG